MTSCLITCDWSVKVNPKNGQFRSFSRSMCLDSRLTVGSEPNQNGRTSKGSNVFLLNQNLTFSCCRTSKPPDSRSDHGCTLPCPHVKMWYLPTLANFGLKIKTKKSTIRRINYNCITERIIKEEEEDDLGKPQQRK